MTKNDLANKAVSLMKERDLLEKKVKQLTLANKKLEKQLRIGDVSQQRELLFAWEKYKKEFPYSDTPISELIEKYTNRKLIAYNSCCTTK